MRAKNHSPETIRSRFPVFNDKDRPLHYLDSAASSQKPAGVIERIQQCYSQEYANIHRGVYQLSEKATFAYEATRDKLATFLGGVSRQEVILTTGTTEGINLIARTWGEENLRQGDEILLTIAEHHSNIVPWQILAEKTGAVVRFIPLREDLRLDMDKARSMINEKTRVVAFAHVSNVLGTIHPVRELISLAKSVGAITVIDGAQAVPHFSVNVRELDCDFYSFSGHKMLGPSGVGVLYGKEALLDAMPPFMGGGDMIASVTTKGSTWNELPYKFEAGTPPIVPVTALAPAIDFLETTDLPAALNHDLNLAGQLIDALKDRPGLRLFANGSREDWVGIVTFFHETIHPHDMAAIQDSHHVCVRAGHHCAQPLMNWLGVPATTRVSPYLYNTQEDIDAFLNAYEEAEKLFSNGNQSR